MTWVSCNMSWIMCVWCHVTSIVTFIYPFIYSYVPSHSCCVCTCFLVFFLYSVCVLCSVVCVLCLSILCVWKNRYLCIVTKLYGTTTKQKLLLLLFLVMVLHGLLLFLQHYSSLVVNVTAGLNQCCKEECWQQSSERQLERPRLRDDGDLVLVHPPLYSCIASVSVAVCDVACGVSKLSCIMWYVTRCFFGFLISCTYVVLLYVVLLYGMIICCMVYVVA